MKEETFQERSPQPDQDSSHLPKFHATNMPTPNTFLLRCGSPTPSCPSISSPTSPSALAVRRLVSCPTQIQPRSLRYDHQVYELLTPPIEIVSPTAIAIRDYHLDLDYYHQPDTPYSGSEIETPQMSIHPVFKTVLQVLSIPRRHSIALKPYPMDLGGTGDHKLRRGSATPPQTLENGCVRNIRNRERWMQNVLNDEDLGLGSPLLTLQQSDIKKLDLNATTEAEQQIHNPLDPRYLGNIPFSYTTNKLREWGDVYLFNSATADAFIRAIAIPTSTPPKIRTTPTSPSDLNKALSDISLSPRDVKMEDTGPIITKQLIKVRVVPQCRTKKPFYMQKYFPIRKPSVYRVSKHVTSPRYHLRHHHEHYQGTRVESLQNMVATEVKRPAVPIHIEYALYRTPLLAAILLCEHVKRGATVEIPLPFPEVLEDVIEWMYTGSSGADVGVKVRETVEYLGGVI